MARKRKGAKPRHTVHHGHVPQRHGELPRTHPTGPSAQDFHFSADEEQAMRKGGREPEGPEDEAPDAEEVDEE